MGVEDSRTDRASGNFLEVVVFSSSLLLLETPFSLLLFDNREVSMSEPYWKPDLSSISASFTYDLGDHGWGNEELQIYTDSPQNAFIGQDGKSIVIRAIADKEEANGNENRYSSARLVSKACLNEEQGYVEACIEAPFAKGIWSAFWLLPKKPFTWPYCGEVDIHECWNGLKENGTCLHWGHFNGQDWDKHRVLKKPVSTGRYSYGFAWNYKEKKLLWFLDGKPTMKAAIPKLTRSLTEFQIVLNVAMGGNVMNGSVPSMPSSHDMIISDLAMYREPPCGWSEFNSTWEIAKEGNTM